MDVPIAYHGSDEEPRGELLLTHRSSASDRLNIHEIVSIFNRRIKLFAIVTFLIFMTAIGVTSNTPKRYTATTEIALNRTTDQVAPKGGGSVVDDEQKSNDVDTEVQVLTSRDLAGRVVDKLGLARDATFISTVRDAREGAIDKLLRNLIVERVKTAFVIGLTYEDTQPARAAQIVNAVAHIYVDWQLAAKRQANARATDFLRDQITRLQTQAEDDMRAVQDYRISNNLLSSSGASLTEQEISAYNQQVSEARAKAVEDAARLATAQRELRTGNLGSDMGLSLASPVVQNLRGQRAAISARVSELSSRYGDKLPELVDARSQLHDIDMQIATEVLRELSSLDAQKRVSAQRLASLQSTLGGAQSTLAQNNAAMVTLDDLTRRATTSQALYESYLDRYKSLTAQTGTETPNARVLSEARTPVAPSSPHVILNLLFGLILGLGLGAAMAIAVELFFTGFTTGDEIEKRLGLPYLGGVPALRSISPHEDTPLATVKAFPQGAFAESFRAVLASLRHRSDSRHSVIAVTSALPGEGKSTLAICLAAAHSAGNSERVIAVDLDVTRHRLSDEIVKDRKRPGLREVLREGAAIDDALVQIDASNFYILPITTPFEKTEHIGRGVLVQALIAKLREHFPLIILDCPPLLPLAEARDLVALADDVVLVAAWRRTRESAVQSAIRLLPPSAAARTGVALTRIDMKKQARFGAGDATSFYKQYRKYYPA